MQSQTCDSCSLIIKAKNYYPVRTVLKHIEKHCIVLCIYFLCEEIDKKVSHPEGLAHVRFDNNKDIFIQNI